MSANLWYEEIVPRESRFYFNIERPNKEEDELFKALPFHGNKIQVGGNATVGYGLCKLKKIDG